MKRFIITAASAALVAVSASAAAQNAYVIGLSGALTGPGASTLAPVIEALRAYVEHVNAQGGVNGKKIQLLIRDNQSSPSKAAADTKQLLSERVVLLVNGALSSTYAPMIAESKRANVPLLFAGSVCPKEVFPPTDPLMFCTTGFGAGYDARMAMSFVKESSKGAVKIGYSAMAIPVSRSEIEYAEKVARDLGMTPVDTEVIPPPTPDYTPFATRLKDAGPNWVFSWAPWVTQVKTLEALRRLDWSGDYLAYSHVEAEDELARLKDPKFYVFGANALVQDALPVHAEMRAVAHRADLKYPLTQLAEGYVAGLVLIRPSPRSHPAKAAS